MGVVILEGKILELEIVEGFFGDDQAGQFTRFTLQLLLQTGDVIVRFHLAAFVGGVNVGVDDGVGELADGEADFLGEHLCERGVTCEIERDAQSDVAGALRQVAV